MPKGCLRPAANVCTSPTWEAPRADRSTNRRPLCWEVTNTSPLGATRTWRAPSMPVAYWVTSKPGGTLRCASAGRGTTLTRLVLEGLAKGSGRDAVERCCWRPGVSVRQSGKIGSGATAAFGAGDAALLGAPRAGADVLPGAPGAVGPAAL